MDLNQITIAQTNPENQFSFNANQFDEAVLRAEERRSLLKRGWFRCRAFFSRTTKEIGVVLQDGHTQMDRVR